MLLLFCVLFWFVLYFVCCLSALPISSRLLNLVCCVVVSAVCCCTVVKFLSSCFLYQTLDCLSPFISLLFIFFHFILFYHNNHNKQYTMSNKQQQAIYEHGVPAHKWLPLCTRRHVWRVNSKIWYAYYIYYMQSCLWPMLGLVCYLCYSYRHLGCCYYYWLLVDTNTCLSDLPVFLLSLLSLYRACASWHKQSLCVSVRASSCHSPSALRPCSLRQRPASSTAASVRGSCIEPPTLRARSSCPSRSSRSSWRTRRYKWKQRRYFPCIDCLLLMAAA